MTLEATDVEQTPVAPAQDEPSHEPELPVQEPPPPAPRTRGRPASAKDKQPRKRQARAQLAWADEEEEPPPRPPTRRSAPPKKSARRVRIVESASSASSAAEEEEEEPSPRTARHRQWAVYRQRKTDAHQANVNRYAALFDRMLA